MKIQRFPALRCSAVTENAVRTAQTFHELAVQAQVQTTLHLSRRAQSSRGLVASERVTRGHVLLRVPATTAIVLDYDSGMSLPASARWPRLRGAASNSSDPLPWDILQALALIDGLAGDGGEFWQRYCDELLPAPDQLTLPLCWQPSRLAELQHAHIANAAAAQQARLRALLPELMEPLASDVPSWLQWAFACVRSRAFRVGPEAFAFVPFMDLANHAEAPKASYSPGSRQPPTANGTTVAGSPTANANFRVSRTTNGDDGRSTEVSTPLSTAAAAAAAGGDGGSFFELVALRDIAPGEEVTICYSGVEGYTNQRYMAQYGFVPRGGNTADRVHLELDAEHQAAPLSLARLQDLLGDGLFLAALRGTDPYLFAALKSLPLKDDDHRNTDDGDGNDNGNGKDPRASDVAAVAAASHRAARGNKDDASMRTATSLLRQVEAYISEGITPLEVDEEMLAGRAGEELLSRDPRLAAAVSYRIERKRLLGTTATLLRAYLRRG